MASILSLLFAAAAEGSWKEPVDEAAPINKSPEASAAQPSLEQFGGTPYIAWAEPDGAAVDQIRVAGLASDGMSWERPGDADSPINVSAGESAEDPALQRNDPADSPCVAFAQASDSATRIHMSCLRNATEWRTVGDSPNADPSAVASQPSLTLFDDETWVAWTETDSSNVNQIRVAKLPPPGTSWVRVPDTASPINADSSNDAFNPDLVVVGADLYLTWGEIGPEPDEVSQIHVAVLDGETGTWDHVGGALNRDPTLDAFEPSMVDIGGVPYVAWSERSGLGHDQIRVARLNGSSWPLVADSDHPINQSLNQDASQPSLTEIAGVPYVAWSEPDSGGVDQIRVARLDSADTAWEHVAGSLNHSAQLDATQASLTTIGGIPYVGWREEDGNGNDQIRATRLEPEFVSQGANAVSDTAATLETQVRTYGLAYPVGFAYGESVELETAPQPAPTGQGDVVSVSLPVSGLTPGTAYAMQPLATAGVPAPRVLSATTTFTTLPVQRQLTVTVGGTGAGTVESTPAGIKCGANTPGATACSQGFDDGSNVTLKADPAPGSSFRGFTGAGCGSSGVSCVVTMSQAQTVSASFEPKATPPNLTAPSTTISKHPKRKTRSTKATFRFSSSAPGSAFVCKLDRKRYRPCESPARYKRLKRGRHTFRVRATDASGRADPSPAKFRWRVRAARR